MNNIWCDQKYLLGFFGAKTFHLLALCYQPQSCTDACEYVDVVVVDSSKEEESAEKCCEGQNAEPTACFI